MTEERGWQTAGGVKIFLFPESYNNLRMELYDNWRDTIWKDVQWAMAFDAEMFVEKMNMHTKGAYRITAVTRDKELEIDHICTCFLTELRKMRGAA